MTYTQIIYDLLQCPSLIKAIRGRAVRTRLNGCSKEQFLESLYQTCEELFLFFDKTYAAGLKQQKIDPTFHLLTVHEMGVAVPGSEHKISYVQLERFWVALQEVLQIEKQLISKN